MKRELVLTNDEILSKIEKIAYEIDKDFMGEDVTLICVLKGASVFACDLLRELPNNAYIEFMQLSSTCGYPREVKIDLDVSSQIAGKNVIIVEDLIDSGYTINYLANYLRLKKPKEIKICSLLCTSLKYNNIIVDYKGFDVEEGEIYVGYGMDYNESYRDLGEIYKLIFEE